MTAPTKAHRLAVARAWEGETLSPFAEEWVERGVPAAATWPHRRSAALKLERLAQLVADAEGAWVPARGVFPQVGDRVLCMSSCDDHLILDYEGAGDFTDPEDDQVTIAVTHWRPLPKPPEST